MRDIAALAVGCPNVSATGSAIGTAAFRCPAAPITMGRGWLLVLFSRVRAE